MANKCNPDCLCKKCAKSCMKACRTCNPVFKMGVRNCKEYVSECTQLNLSDFLSGIEEMCQDDKKNECEGK